MTEERQTAEAVRCPTCHQVVPKGIPAYPTLENVSLEILFGIVWKIVAKQQDGGYLDLEYPNNTVIDMHIQLTEDEADVMRRMERLIDG